MRALHLAFRLYHAYEIRETPDPKEGYFAGAESFREAEQRDYQPLFALLERNAQKYPKMRVSLVVSGAWIEQAEQWAPELVKRLKKLVASDNVDIITTPYYDSLAAFYDMDEFAAQVKRDREKIEATLGASSVILALPEYLYHNRIARWAEKADFQGVLAGNATSVLDWRTCNRVYDAKGCENLRILFMNTHLTRNIARADASIMTYLDANGGKKAVYSAAKLQKQLDLASLRGNLLNLYFDASLFGERRELGVIGLFDDLIETWMETSGYCLMDANSAIRLPAAAEISVKQTISTGRMASKDYVLPEKMHHKAAEELYALRQPILATKDRDLYADFAKLTMFGIKYDEKFGTTLKDIARRIKIAATTLADEEQNDHSLAQSHRVDVKIKRNPAKKAKQAEFIKKVKDAVGEADSWLNMDDLDDAEAEVQVLAQRISWQALEKERDTTGFEEAEIVEATDEEEIDTDKKASKAKKSSKNKDSLRDRISRKIVIE